MKWGESGILEDGEAKTGTPPSFEDEELIKVLAPSEADNEGSVMEDIDMSIEEENGEENDRIVAHSITVCTM